MSAYMGSNLNGATGSAAGQGQRLMGKSPRGYDQVNNFTPEQMQLFQQMFGHVGQNSYTSRLASGDQSLFDEMEAPAMRQFSGMQGNLASRFSGMGMGARNSSGFQNTANQASSDFAQDLQGKRQGLQRQAIQDLMSMSESLMGQRPYSYQKKQNSFLQDLLLSMSGGLGAAGANFGGSSFLKQLGFL